MDWLTPHLTKHAEIGVFLAIGLGYWIGKFKFKGVGFGPVTGSLIAGLVIDYFSLVPVSDTAKGLSVNNVDDQLDLAERDDRGGDAVEREEASLELLASHEH